MGWFLWSWSLLPWCRFQFRNYTKSKQPSKHTSLTTKIEPVDWDSPELVSTFFVELFRLSHDGNWSNFRTRRSGLYSSWISLRGRRHEDDTNEQEQTPWPDHGDFCFEGGFDDACASRGALVRWHERKKDPGNIYMGRFCLHCEPPTQLSSNTAKWFNLRQCFCLAYVCSTLASTSACEAQRFEKNVTQWDIYRSFFVEYTFAFVMEVLEKKIIDLLQWTCEKNVTFVWSRWTNVAYSCVIFLLLFY